MRGLFAQRSVGSCVEIHQLRVFTLASNHLLAQRSGDSFVGIRQLLVLNSSGLLGSAEESISFCFDLADGNAEVLRRLIVDLGNGNAEVIRVGRDLFAVCGNSDVVCGNSDMLTVSAGIVCGDDLVLQSLFLLEVAEGFVVVVFVGLELFLIFLLVLLHLQLPGPDCLRSG